MAIKKAIRFCNRGQSATEYLLTLAAVLLAFLGVVISFSNQINNYLSMLLKILALPF
jgi:uncharacterized protein (UPF0333 family)